HPSGGGSGQALNQLDELVPLVAVVPGKVEQLTGVAMNGALLGSAADGDAPAAAELEQALLAELPERAQHGVAVDPEDGREVACRRKPLARPGLAVGDCPADLGRHLLVQVVSAAAVDVDSEQWCHPY